jgi:hypothetical protein
MDLAGTELAGQFANPPLSAAKATFALNVALCFCRDCFMTAPVSEPFIEAGLSHRHLSHIRGPPQSAGEGRKTALEMRCLKKKKRMVATHAAGEEGEAQAGTLDLQRSRPSAKRRRRQGLALEGQGKKGRLGRTTASKGAPRWGAFQGRGQDDA